MFRSRRRRKEGRESHHASGKTVMPGDVDSHAHVAGAKVNAGRMMRPEDHDRSIRQKTTLTDSGRADTRPSVDKQATDDAAMGYTTGSEAAMLPLEARQTHEEMRVTPIGTWGVPGPGNEWFIMRDLRDGEIEKLPPTPPG